MNPILRRRLARTLLCLVAATAASSCDATLSTGLAGLRGPITFSVREINFDAAGPRRSPVIAVLLLYDPRNESAAGCSYLETQLGVSSTVVTIHLVGLRQFSCDPLTDYCACAQVLLPPLLGNYELRIATDERTDRYALSVTETAITIAPTHAVFTVPQFTRAWRYPENSFAAVCYTGTSDATGCESLEGLLTGIPGLTPFSFPPGGQIPFPEEENGTLGVYGVSYYRYTTEDAYSRAQEQLRDFLPSFRATYPAGFIYLTNWLGEYS
jgi:hypothetical protein